MATAISFVSESGDHYLELFEGDETVEGIVGLLKEKYSDEFQYLYVQNCLSSTHNVPVLEGRVCEAIEGASGYGGAEQ
jgi:hypothetical protein